jgi:hypothetical protein
MESDGKMDFALFMCAVRFPRRDRVRCIFSQTNFHESKFRCPHVQGRSLSSLGWSAHFHFALGCLYHYSSSLHFGANSTCFEYYATGRRKQRTLKCWNKIQLTFASKYKTYAPVGALAHWALGRGVHVPVTTRRREQGNIKCCLLSWWQDIGKRGRG